MRNRTILLMAVSALTLAASWQAQTQPKGPVVRLEGEAIQVKGGAPSGYLIVTVNQKGESLTYALELGRALVCRPGEPCEPCGERVGCVNPPQPIVDPRCPTIEGIPCIRGVYGTHRR